MSVGIARGESPQRPTRNAAFRLLARKEVAAAADTRHSHSPRSFKEAAVTGRREAVKVAACPFQEGPCRKSLPRGAGFLPTACVLFAQALFRLRFACAFRGVLCRRRDGDPQRADPLALRREANPGHGICRGTFIASALVTHSKPNEASGPRRPFESATR